MAPGEVLASASGAVRDFEAFYAPTGHQLVAQSERHGEFRFEIRKT